MNIKEIYLIDSQTVVLPFFTHKIRTFKKNMNTE